MTAQWHQPGVLGSLINQARSKQLEEVDPKATPVQPGCESQQSNQCLSTFIAHLLLHWDPTSWLMKVQVWSPQNLRVERENLAHVGLKSAQDMRHNFFSCQTLSSCYWWKLGILLPTECWGLGSYDISRKNIVREDEWSLFAWNHISRFAKSHFP